MYVYLTVIHNQSIKSLVYTTSQCITWLVSAYLCIINRACALANSMWGTAKW